MKFYIKYYLERFISKRIFKFFYKAFEKVSTVPKNELRIALPYLGNILNIIILKKALNENLKLPKLKVTFERTNRRKNYFHYKDLVPSHLNFNSVCKCSC